MTDKTKCITNQRKAETMEIERKFRIKSISQSILRAANKCEIRQGYLQVPTGELRVRQKDSHYFLTIKGDGTISRDEFETEIPGWTFSQLWQATAGRQIEKTRYTINHNHQTLEIDVYGGKLHGLIILECEFNSLEESENFELPSWIQGEEVTENKAYKNKNLAANGLPTG